jgi:hypothetical protein
MNATTKPAPTAEDREWSPADIELAELADELPVDGAEVELLADDAGLARARARADARWLAREAAAEAERSARLDACIDAKVAAGWRSTSH